jgi:hypothetical protein
MENTRDAELVKHYTAPKGWRSWSTRKKFLAASLVLLVVAVGIGLGVGLGTRHRRGHEEGSNPTSGGNTTAGNTTASWQPAVASTWQIELITKFNDSAIDVSFANGTSGLVDVYDIDLFYTDVETISKIHDSGRKVICYFSAGSYENWRPDKDKFLPSDLGNVLEGWPNEKWLKLSSANVRNIMLSRLDMASNKSCDGVDPDNVDGYDNNNGLGLTKEDSVDYLNFLADAAHSRGMSIGLKNANRILGHVMDQMQWSVNEQCAQFQECPSYDAFIKAGKPVFHIEYPKGTDPDDNNNALVTGDQKDSACNFDDSSNFSTVIKNLNLDLWIETC